MHHRRHQVLPCLQHTPRDQASEVINKVRSETICYIKKVEKGSFVSGGSLMLHNNNVLDSYQRHRAINSSLTTVCKGKFGDL